MSLNFKRRFNRAARVGTAITLGVSLKSFDGGLAAAHSRTDCRTSSAPVMDANGYVPAKGGTYVPFRLSPNTILGVNDTARDQARAVMSAWASQTNITTAEVTTAGAWDIYFTSMTNDDTTVAGQMSPTVSRNAPYPPSGTNPDAFWCTYTHAQVRWNTSHIAVAGNWAGNDKGCIFAHEVGHALGLAHSNIAAHHDSTGEAAHSAADSIMRGKSHDSRCHVSEPPTGPRASDKSDTNAYY